MFLKSVFRLQEVSKQALASPAFTYARSYSMIDMTSCSFGVMNAIMEWYQSFSMPGFFTAYPFSETLYKDETFPLHLIAHQPLDFLSAGVWLSKYETHYTPSDMGTMSYQRRFLP
jgi:hypothetical protein